MNGRMEDEGRWKDGRMERWKDESMEDEGRWKTGMMERRKD
jgi:hypothetical protein